MSSRLLNRDVGIRRRLTAVRDRFGDQEVTYTPAEPVKAYLERLDTTEATLGVDVQQSTWLVVLAPDVQITGRDVIEVYDEVPGQTLTLGVDGPPSTPRVGRRRILTRLKARSVDSVAGVA